MNGTFIEEGPEGSEEMIETRNNPLSTDTHYHVVEELKHYVYSTEKTLLQDFLVVLE